jgi:aminoglycoside phosphotransferase (APT) family kinase protein
MPRRAIAAALIEHEQRWLPQLARVLPLPIPVPQRVGRPGCGFPWDRAVSTPAWSGPPLWIHGDLHPGNLLVSEDNLAAVIDFGDLAAGDPATDLSIAWMLFPPSARPVLLAAARGPCDPIDDDTWIRARAWALALGLSYLVNSRDDPALRELGVTTINAVLADGDASAR